MAFYEFLLAKNVSVFALGDALDEVLLRKLDFKSYCSVTDAAGQLSIRETLKVKLSWLGRLKYVTKDSFPNVCFRDASPAIILNAPQDYCGVSFQPQRLFRTPEGTHDDVILGFLNGDGTRSLRSSNPFSFSFY